MKRVLLIAPQQFFINRGTPLNVSAMARSLASHGYAVDLLVFPVGEEITIPGVQILRSPRFPGIRSVPIGPSWRKIILDFFLVFYAMRLVMKHRYAALHGVEEGAIVAGLLNYFWKVPFVYDMDSSMPDHLESSGFIRSKLLLKWARSIERAVMCRAAAILTVCQALTEKAEAIGADVPIWQIEDFPVGSSTEFSQQQVAALRMEFGLSGRPVVLYTGNFQKYQGIDLLINGFAEYLEAYNTASTARSPLLLLVGGGDERDPLFRKYQAKVERLGIAESVVFTGSRPLEEMGAFMALSDVLTSPRTEGENTPLKIYTYMAAEKPVVVTDIKSHTQVMDESVCFLATPTPRAFASAIAQALDESVEGKTIAKSKAKKALQLIETKYNESVFSERLGELYADIIGPANADAQNAENVARKVSQESH